MKTKYMSLCKALIAINILFMGIDIAFGGEALLEGNYETAYKYAALFFCSLFCAFSLFIAKSNIEQDLKWK